MQHARRKWPLQGHMSTRLSGMGGMGCSGRDGAGGMGGVAWHERDGMGEDSMAYTGFFVVVSQSF